MPLKFADPAPGRDAYPLIIKRLLESAVRHAGPATVTYRDQVTLSYPQLADRVARLAGMLRSMGVEEGATVAVMDWDSHRYLEAYFAVPMMGAVLLTVNVRLSPGQIGYCLETAGADVILCHRDFLPLAEALRGSRQVIVCADGTNMALPEWSAGEYEALIAEAKPHAFADFDENAVATTFFTTGTTGNPKQVVFTHRQLVLQALAANAPFGVTHSRGFGVHDVYMPLTPMFHVHAWGMPYIATMLGVNQVYPGRYEPDFILQLREQHGVTFSHCVPTILQMVIAAADARGHDLSGWFMIIGGSALTGALFEEGRKRGMHLTAGYGMSETCPTISIARPFQPGDENDSEVMTRAGSTAPLVLAEIVDGDMNPLPHDGKAKGELVLRAPWLTGCYAGDAAASAELWRGGWMHTQDVATIDAHGTIEIRDRLKDVIKTGGEWIDSLALEDMIAELPCVGQVAVIGVPDARWGERPLAVVVPGTTTPTVDAVNGRLRQAVEGGSISKFALVDRVEVVDALPLTSVGKVDKKLLRANYGG